MKTLHDMRLKRRSTRLRMLAWTLLLLAGHGLQVAAVTHWHSAQPAVADAVDSRTPSPDLPGHDGCVLCQVAAHAGGSAPPPAPWILHVAQATQDFVPHDAESSSAVLPLSHAWQGRAPPQA